MREKLRRLSLREKGSPMATDRSSALLALAVCAAVAGAATPSAAFSPMDCTYVEPGQLPSVGSPAPIASAGAGDQEFRQGLDHYLGRQTPRDPTEAARWFRTSAEAGNARARYFLADMYSRGDGVPQDYVAARDMLNSAVPGLTGPTRRNAACYAASIDRLLEARENGAVPAPTAAALAVTSQRR